MGALEELQLVSAAEYFEIQQQKLEESVTFTWVRPTIQLTTSYYNHNTDLHIKMDENIFQSLPKDIQQKCTAINNIDIKSKYTHCFEYKTIVQTEQPAERETDSLNYYIGTPHHAPSNTPKNISREDLASIIKDKKVLFYTGAGISALTVPSMSQLESMLGFVYDKNKLNPINTIGNIISEPHRIANQFIEFIHTCAKALPTEAHKALTLICMDTKSSIITENIDLLHEAAGIKPNSTACKEVHKWSSAENLQKIDMLICIGLSYDDRGFIGKYKACNQNGIVVALDLIKPRYLDHNDLVLLGDVQTNLPLLSVILNE